MDNADSLKDRILSEMTVNHADALEKNFEIAKQFIQITTTGKVNIVGKERFNAKDRVALYLVGKVYAKKADLSKDEYVDRPELVSELGLSIGTIDPTLKDLVDARIIEKNKDASATKYAISLGKVEQLLKSVEQKSNR